MNHIQKGFEKFRNNIFIVDPKSEQRFTYGAINTISSHLATELSKKGINAGNRVCILAGTRVEHVLVYFALLKLRAIPISLNIRRTSKEIGEIVTHSKAHKVLIMPMLFKKYLKVLDHSKVILIPELSKMMSLYYDEYTNYLGFSDRNDDELLSIAYTSGTTGTPKGVMQKYNGWIEATSNYAAELRIDDSTVILQALPIWQGGAIITFIISVLTGATIVLIDMLTMPNFFENYWDVVEKYNVNYLYTFPGMLSSLLLEAERNPREKYPEVKYAKVSSAVLLPEVRYKFEEVFGIKIIENYGSTEGNAIAITNPDEPYNGSVGKIIGSCPLKVSETGELLLKNEKWFAGYLFEEKLTRESFEDGWFKMVDIVEIKDDYVYLLGRVDAIIRKSGETIIPKEIDNALLKNELVYESYTLGYNIHGYKTNSRDDTIFSIISMKKTVEDYGKCISLIKEFCCEVLPPYYRPDEIIIVDKIPKTTADKVSRTDIINIIKENYKDEI